MKCWKQNYISSFKNFSETICCLRSHLVHWQTDISLTQCTRFKIVPSSESLLSWYSNASFIDFNKGNRTFWKIRKLTKEILEFGAGVSAGKKESGCLKADKHLGTAIGCTVAVVRNKSPFVRSNSFTSQILKLQQLLIKPATKTW